MKNYLNTLKHFVLWLNVPLEEAGRRQVLAYIDLLLDRRRTPKTINCHLNSIRRFYDYLYHEEEIKIPNPVREGDSLRLPKPLPCFLKEEEIRRLFAVIKGRRDHAIFLLMLRCGLRVEEAVHLTVDAVDLVRQRIHVHLGKGGKGRMVCISKDACEALKSYLEIRPPGACKRLFLVEKGAYKNKPISVRGVQKRMEYYSRATGVRGQLPSVAPHHGDPTAECRCRSCHHSGSTRTQLDHNDSTIL